jgi:hypothetical protein
LSRLNDLFFHSEREWLQKGDGKSVVFKSHAPAKGLSKLLFKCPACKQIDCLADAAYSIRCLECGYRANIDNALNVTDGNATGFSDIWQWHSWQLKEWAAEVQKGLVDNVFERQAKLQKTELVRVDKSIEGIVTRAGYHSRFMGKPEKYSARFAVLDKGGITIQGKGRIVLKSISVAEISSVRVFMMRMFKPNWLLIGTAEGYYKIMFLKESHPAYSWCLALKQMMGSLPDKLENLGE